jgi:hypothetical protein
MTCFPANPLFATARRPPSHEEPEPPSSTQFDARIRTVCSFIVPNSSVALDDFTSAFRQYSVRTAFPTIQPLPAALPHVANPRCAPKFIKAHKTDETSRSESDDPVCRPIRLLLFRFSLFRLSSHLACAAETSRSKAPGVQGCAAPIVSGRFRAGKLVGSRRYSKCFFAGVQCFAVMTLSGRI